MAKLKGGLKKSYIGNINKQAPRQVGSMAGDKYSKKRCAIQKMSTNAQRENMRGVLKASNIFIHDSKISLENLGALPDDMQEIILAIQNNTIDGYDKNNVTRVILSFCEFNRAEEPKALKIYLREGKEKDVKLSNIKLNMFNLLKYLDDSRNLVKYITEKDIIAVITTAIVTIAQLKSDMTVSFDKDAAHFLRYLYITHGQKKLSEEAVIEAYNATCENKSIDEIRNTINWLVAMGCLSLDDGMIRIEEKVSL